MHFLIYTQNVAHLNKSDLPVELINTIYYFHLCHLTVNDNIWQGWIIIMCSLRKKIFHYPCISAKLETEEIKATDPLHLRIPGEEEHIIISLKFSNGDRLKIKPGDSIYNSDSQYLYIDKEKNYLVKKNLEARNKLEDEIGYLRNELIEIKYSDLNKKKKIKKFSETSDIMKEYIKIKEEYDEWFRHNGTESANITHSEIKTINKELYTQKNDGTADDDLKHLQVVNEKQLKKIVNELVEKKQELVGNNRVNENIEMEQLKTEDKLKNQGKEEKRSLIDFKKLLPQKVKWTQIEINILDDDSIKIKYPGGSFDVRFSQTQYFVNKTTSRCNNLWGLLIELAQIGSFQPKSSTYKILTNKPGKAKHRVYALGKALMNEIGILEKPFLPYNSQDGWLPKFTIRDLRKNIIRTKTQAEIYKSQQTVKRKRHQKSLPKIGDTYTSDDNDSYANEQKDHIDKLDHNELGFHNITEDEL